MAMMSQELSHMCKEDRNDEIESLRQANETLLKMYAKSLEVNDKLSKEKQELEYRLQSLEK